MDAYLDRGDTDVSSMLWTDVTLVVTYHPQLATKKLGGVRCAWDFGYVLDAMGADHSAAAGDLSYYAHGLGKVHAHRRDFSVGEFADASRRALGTPKALTFAIDARPRETEEDGEPDAAPPTAGVAHAMVRNVLAAQRTRVHQPRRELVARDHAVRDWDMVGLLQARSVCDVVRDDDGSVRDAGRVDRHACRESLGDSILAGLHRAIKLREESLMGYLRGDPSADEGDVTLTVMIVGGGGSEWQIKMCARGRRATGEVMWFPAPYGPGLSEDAAAAAAAKFAPFGEAAAAGPKLAIEPWEWWIEFPFSGLKVPIGLYASEFDAAMKIYGIRWRRENGRSIEHNRVVGLMALSLISGAVGAASPFERITANYAETRTPGSPTTKRMDLLKDLVRDAGAGPDAGAFEGYGGGGPLSREGIEGLVEFHCLTVLEGRNLGSVDDGSLDYEELFPAGAAAAGSTIAAGVGPTIEEVD